MTTETSRYALASRLVEREVIYCVSGLIATLARREWDGSDGIDPDDLLTLAYRAPGVDEYREAAIEAGYYDKPRSGMDSDPRIDIVRTADENGVFWEWTHDDEDGDFVANGGEDTEIDAWRAAAESVGLDTPDGSEVYEHWIVSTYLAGKLREHGETVVDDVAGLTVWGRCTTGQAISMDYVIQKIAEEIYGSDDDADLEAAAADEICTACHRISMDCSRDPCPAVIADRGDD